MKNVFFAFLIFPVTMVYMPIGDLESAPVIWTLIFMLAAIDVCCTTFKHHSDMSELRVVREMRLAIIRSKSYAEEFKNRQALLMFLARG